MGWIGVLLKNKLQKVAVDFPSVKELKPLISQLWHGQHLNLFFYVMVEIKSKIVQWTISKQGNEFYSILSQF